MKDHGLLNEKYRPTLLDNFVGNEQLKQQIQTFLSQNDLVNMLFYGPPGSGKTTLAKLIVKNLDCDYLMINASDERGIETIRDKVAGFASSASFKPIKVVILDEADFLTIQAQASLRNIIETFSRTTRFILTCNYIERIIDPLQSRCQALKVIPPSKGDVAKHISSILDQENIKYELDDLKSLINKFYPDLRKMLNTIQLCSKEGKFHVDESIIVNSNYMSLVLKELTNKKPNWKEIRQTIANSGVSDFEELYRFLYENAEKYLPEREGSATVLINEHLFQSNFRIDKEINILSLISKLIELK
jgi:replication factor C small subunit